jgi:ADP-ribosylglycohydrolase
VWTHFVIGFHVTLTAIDRATACLKGIAIGDAIGKQTEMLSPEDVVRWYPHGIRGFGGEPGSVIPRYRGNKKREWRFGETTDDTERTIAVARAIIADKSVSHVSIGREMLGCTKCVHPGVRSLWEFHQAADPMRIAVAHDGCGAAIRVAPVGIFYASSALHQLVRGAWEASVSTHGGSLAIAAAAATAAAVSAAIDGASPQDVLELAEEAAAQSENQCAGRVPAFATAIRTVYDRVASFSPLTSADVATCCFPNKPLTIVPLALGLATVMRSAEDAILLATNVGGDSDSVASVAGGILAAMDPSTVNERWYETVEAINQIRVVPIARELASLRRNG